jgi:RNA polymerase sigma-70 factor (ECF subfamily)
VPDAYFPHISLVLRVIAKTTPGGIRCIRRGGCAVIGPLARNRPSDPDASTAPRSRNETTAAQPPKTVTEADAIRLAQAGDASAFEFLYGLHGRRVYALCLRMLGNPSDAEDLMQEAFLQLFRKIGTFRGESAFSTWLHRMTVNVVLMRLRKKTLPAASLEEMTEPDEDAGGPRKDLGAPDLRLSGAVDRVNLERSIEKLPPGYRTVFVLHDVQGYEHNEIAGIMGCSVGNSKSQLHKARTRLRDLLQEEVRAQARQERHEAKAQTGLGD